MLRVNLNMLLAERNITATRLSKETGISKTTLTSLVNNTGKGVQYDTIDTICNFLGVTPNDFFDYIPIDYVFDYENIKFSIDFVSLPPYGQTEMVDKIDYKFNLTIDVKTSSMNKAFEFSGGLIEENITKNSVSLNVFIIDFEFINNEDEPIFNDVFYNKLTGGHQNLFDKKVKECIESRFKEKFEDTTKEKGLLASEHILERVMVGVPWERLPF